MRARPAVIALLFLLLTVILPPAVRAQSGSVALDSYWEALAELQTALDAGVGAEELAAHARHLEGITAVELPDGTQLPVDNRYLAGLLLSDPPRLVRATAVLEQVSDFREEGRADFSGDDMAALAAILASAAYSWPEEAPPNPLAELWQRFLTWTSTLLARVFSGTDLGSIGSAVVIAVIALLLGLILRYVYVQSIRSVVREAETGPDAPLPPGLTAGRAFDRAQALSEAGDLREAVRFLYLAALLVLEDRGHIRLDRAHTNRELLEDLAPHPDLAARFREVVETFDRVWYGFRGISREEFGRYSETVAELGT